jgi:lysophospholipase
VVVSPGRTEAIEKYFEVAARLTERGFVVLVHDWRGQGLADRLLPDRLLGHAAGHADFIADFAALLDVFESRLPHPWIALGHSMGGCLTLLALARGKGRFVGAILSAPMLGVLTGAVPRPIARALAGIMTVVGLGGRPTPGPRGDRSAPFETNILTHDRRRYERNEGQLAACPDLRLGAPTWGWLNFAFQATSFLAREASVTRLTIPICIMTASEDVLVDNAAAKAVAARLPRGRLIEIPGAFHELLQETDAVQSMVWREFDALASEVAPPR